MKHRHGQFRDRWGIVGALLPGALGIGAIGAWFAPGSGLPTAWFFATGLLVGVGAAAVTERLLAIEEEAGPPPEDDERALSWKERIPILGPYFGGPFDPPLAWFEYIPLVSLFIDAWRSASFRNLVPRGGQRADRTWPVTLACALLFAAFGPPDGLTWRFVGIAGIGVTLIIASAIDWKIQIIPDEVNCAGLAFALGYVGLTQAGAGSPGDAARTLGAAAVGALTGAGVLYLLDQIGRMLVGCDAVGGGDIKLMGFVGAFLGWQGALATVVGSVWLMAPVGLVLRATGQVKVENGLTRMAYGPFLAAAALIVLRFGPVWR